MYDTNCNVPRSSSFASSIGHEISAWTFNFFKRLANGARIALSSNLVETIVRLVRAVNEKIKLGANADNILLAGSLSAQIGQELSLAAGELVSQGDQLDIKLLVNGFLEHSQLAYKYSQDLEAEINKINIGITILPVNSIYPDIIKIYIKVSFSHHLFKCEIIHTTPYTYRQNFES